MEPFSFGLITIGDLTMCDGKCVDTKTDPNHCGVCGNKAPEGAGCSNGKICVKSGDYARSGVDYPSGCCDSGDESFVYLNGRSECKETKYLKDPNHNYSYPYCLASSQITSITSSGACITRNADINHLSDASSCGTTFSQDGNIKCHYSIHETSNSDVTSQKCELGKCCFDDGVYVAEGNCGDKVYKDGICTANVVWDKSFCCGGHAYCHSVTYYGQHCGCTSDSDFCKKDSHSDCVMDDDITQTAGVGCDYTCNG